MVNPVDELRGARAHGVHKKVESCTTEEVKSKSGLRRERARRARSTVEQLRVRMDEELRTKGSRWFTFSEVVNKHIFESTGELAEDVRDVTKVLGSVGREVVWLSISAGEFGEDFEVGFVVS